MTTPAKKIAKPKSSNKAGAPLDQRGYKEVTSLNGQNSDWNLNRLTEDADVWHNARALTSRVRDLFRTNPIYQSYRETLWANVFGSDGIMLRSRVKETEDRIVQNPDEKRAIKSYEERRERVFDFFATRKGGEFKSGSMLHTIGKGANQRAQIKVGDPDVYARQLIEKRWAEWQRKEFCDARGTRNYHTLRQLRLIGAVRDGDFFIRMVKDPGANKFGFTLQMIAPEWCDRFFNALLPNGNEVRMGIEYETKPWGIGKVVAYHFIKRQPNDWQFTMQTGFNFIDGSLHDRIPASEIIHYARPIDADSTRPAPWVASTIPKARQLDQYELAEVIAARSEACKTGWLTSTVVPEGGFAGDTPQPDPQNIGRKLTIEAGGLYGLPWGVEFTPNDPTHPSGNFESFRKAMLRSNCAGMPGANYSTMANDYEAINFSAGRLQRLDSNELFKMLQTFDIDNAETPIFENWLEMSLITGAIPLPLAKFDKFNNQVFQGRRWQGVDEIKEVNAAALRVANHFSSDQRECADKGLDFEELMFEQAEANMLKEMLGLSTMKTVEMNVPQQPAQDSESPADLSAKEPAKKQ